MSTDTDNTATTPEVTEALRFFLSAPPGLSETYGFDSQNYVCRKTVVSDDEVKLERLLEPYGTGAERRMLPLALFQRDIPSGDLMLVSPFSQGVGANPPAEWFHRQQRVAAQTALVTLVDVLLRTALEHKNAPTPTTSKAKKAKEAEPTLAPSLLRLISPIIEDVDDKVPTEFNRFIEHCAKERKVEDMLNVYYARLGNQATITCGLINNPASVEGRFARKKTLTIVTSLVRALLGVGPDDKTLDAFTTKAQPDAQPRMSAVMGALLKYYTQLNPVLELLLPTMVVDTGTWQTHLMRFPAYTATSMRANTPVFIDASSAAPKSTPAPVPGTTSGLPGTKIPTPINPLAHTRPNLPPAMMAPMAAQPQTVTIPGGRMADGSQAPPVTVVPRAMVPGQPTARQVPGMMVIPGIPSVGAQLMPPPSFTAPMGLGMGTLGGPGMMGGVMPGVGSGYGLHPGQPMWRR